MSMAAYVYSGEYTLALPYVLVLWNVCMYCLCMFCVCCVCVRMVLCMYCLYAVYLRCGCVFNKAICVVWCGMAVSWRLVQC